MAAKKIKPETLYMRGAAQRSLRSAFAQYLDWKKAEAEDRGDVSQASKYSFITWLQDTIEDE